MSDAADDFVYVIDPMTDAVVFHEINDFHCDCWVYKVGCADFNSSGSGKHEFDLSLIHI